MSLFKVISIIGTRPEATKMCPLIIEMNKNKNITSLLCVTAQHRQMLDQVLDLFKLKPDYDLNIMKQNQSLTDITSGTLKGLEKVFKLEKPDLVLVHGDTTTTLSASLAAFYQQINVGHVEAGLRSYNNYEPFPEEMNRKLVTGLSTIHFAPTVRAKENLLRENISSKNIYVTGNTAVDCLKITLDDNYKFSLDLLNTIDYKNKKIITITAHRRENLGEPLKNICNAINRLTDKYADLIVIYAVHYNPKVRDTVYKILGKNRSVYLIEPLDMNDMHNLIKRSYFVLTDSGGIQEESPSMNVPVLVLRNVTERPEGLEAGTLKLAGTTQESIYNMASNLIDNKDIYKKMAASKNPYGDGNASGRIVASILYHFGIVKKIPAQFQV